MNKFFLKELVVFKDDPNIYEVIKITGNTLDIKNITNENVLKGVNIKFISSYL